VSCPYCHADNRTDITYSCWTKVGDDELARSERCLRNEIKQHKERIRRLEEAGGRMRLYCADPDDCFAWDKAKEAKL
jgi:glutaredoxin